MHTLPSVHLSVEWRFFQTTILALLVGFSIGVTVRAGNADRLAYLDANDPYAVHRTFAKLTTPQWVGEDGIEAVVILSIDDMSEPERWETYLRPILERLEKIDGRAPVSIMSCHPDPDHPLLKKWLEEGLSLETHTLNHPHPLLRDGDFAAAKSNFDRCVDLLASVPGNRPVAFRMPWCDTSNTPSPRFYAEIFNATTEKGNFLSIDSSVFNLLTPEDPDLPKQLVVAADGEERFRRYLPREGFFANTVENYPYPYVIGRLCWEFPCVVPDDSQAFRLKKKIDPGTLGDLEAALDAIVLKQGTFTLVFHPHGWLRSEHIVELVDHAVGRHGDKVKFLTFREAQERIDRWLLGGHPLRTRTGQDGGVRLIDLDNDGFLDVVIGGPDAATRRTRLWKPQRRVWVEGDFPVSLVTTDGDGRRRDAGVRFGVVRDDGYPTAIVRNDRLAGAWHFDGSEWAEDRAFLDGLDLDGKPVFTARAGRDRGVRFRDVERSGHCRLLVSNESQNAVFRWRPDARRWTPLPWALPRGVSLVDGAGRDNGLRLVDLNHDGYDDVVFSNARRFSVDLFIPRPEALRAFPAAGWTRPVSSGPRAAPGAIPMIVRDGSRRDNGAWFHGDHLVVQNEDTSAMDSHVDRRSFAELVVGYLPPPLSPEESMRTFRIAPRFRVELVAAEPLVRDPIALEWGADGRLWVVEMRDYPLGVDGEGTPGGVVKFLEDRDGDGELETPTVFLSGLRFPTGVMPWRRGVIISAAPEIFYAEDTSGNGRADLRRTLFTGFREGNQQHRVNGFQYGLDNWIHGANGSSGGTIRSLLTGTTVDIRGRDFRFRPDDGTFEADAGVTEFGRNRDDWGNWFGNNHPFWGWHYVLPERYLQRNPHLAVRTNKRRVGESNLAYRISRVLARPQMARRLDFSTAPCCIMPYRDDYLGAEFADSFFIGEVDKNIIHREVLIPDGVSFRSRRTAEEKEREFLASTDNWFRPTMTKTGPDGALYIVDMYRRLIEHSEYYPQDVVDLIDFRAGHDRGRIYRVVRADVERRRPLRLDTLDTAGLVAALESRNGWQRDTAQRLLVERQDATAAPRLARLVAGDSPARTRLQALCTLDGIGGLSSGLLVRCLDDAHPRIRQHAVRLTEPLLRRGPDDALGSALIARVSDPDIRVRFQLAFTLGEWSDPRAGRALAVLALRDGDDEYFRSAAFSSAMPHVAIMLEAALGDERGRKRSRLIEGLLDLAVAGDDDGAIATALERVARQSRDGDEGYEPWQMTAVAAFLDACNRHGRSADTAIERAGLSLDALGDEARRLATDATASDARRSAAVGLLGRQQDDIDKLTGLLTARAGPSIQRAAFGRLRTIAAETLATSLLSRWNEFGPAMRSDILSLLLGRKSWTEGLLAAVEDGTVSTRELDAAQRQRLLQHSSAEIRQRTADVLVAVATDRARVVARFREVLDLEGDHARGAKIFAEKCSSCHRLRGEGKEVGPDLSGYATKPVRDLLVAILDPNRNIAGGYLAYTAITAEGRVITGILAAETASSVTLKTPGGTEEVLLRNELLQLTATGRSLMPEGLENDVSVTALADLLARIRGS